MGNIPNDACDAPCVSGAARLNRDCFCKTLNRQQLLDKLQSQSLPEEVLHNQQQLFSQTAVFISPHQWQQIEALVQAVTRTVALPDYQQLVLTHAPQIAQQRSAVAGVFMGYDFHLGDSGPKIIEINTNAGGGFLNAALLSAQTACCNSSNDFPTLQTSDVEQEFVTMFQQEWALARGDRPLKVIAIVDDNPTQQFLYPEFLIAQNILQRAGITTLILDSSELEFTDQQLFFRGKSIDMVYNRLTDFSLSAAINSALRLAYENESIVLTPNPNHHALYADKRNLALLSNADLLRKIGVSEPDIAVLFNGIPHTQLVTNENAEDLWLNRKKLFFKPATGFGGRAAYRGDKITKRVWAEILQANYIAQQQIPPSERGIMMDNEKTALKMDIRAYVYAGNIQLLAARLYQGQTTNFRTSGGGFAPVFVVK